MANLTCGAAAAYRSFPEDIALNNQHFNLHSGLSQAVGDENSFLANIVACCEARVRWC
ncbi:MAG: hypothetical protein K2L81_06175 [Muribaculaceae bacterium]|nr:hypothetical protein [Muribaculaceae bacterium]